MCKEKERSGHVLMMHQVACTMRGWLKQAVQSLQFSGSLPALRGFSSGGVGVEDTFFFALDIAITWLVPCSVIAERWSQQSQWLLVCTTSVSERKPVKSMDAKKAL